MARQSIPVRGHPIRDAWTRLWGGETSEALSNPPRHHQRENEDDLQVEVQLPGFRTRDIEVSSEGGRLAIAARHERAGRRRALRREAFLALRFDDRFDPELGRADFRDGHLRVVLPLRESARPRRIPVRAG